MDTQKQGPDSSPKASRPSTATLPDGQQSAEEAYQQDPSEIHVLPSEATSESQQEIMWWAAINEASQEEDDAAIAELRRRAEETDSRPMEKTLDPQQPWKWWP